MPPGRTAPARLRRPRRSRGSARSGPGAPGERYRLRRAFEAPAVGQLDHVAGFVDRRLQRVDPGRGRFRLAAAACQRRASVDGSCAAELRGRQAEEARKRWLPVSARPASSVRRRASVLDSSAACSTACARAAPGLGNRPLVLTGAGPSWSRENHGSAARESGREKETEGYADGTEALVHLLRSRADEARKLPQASALK